MRFRFLPLAAAGLTLAACQPAKKPATTPTPAPTRPAGAPAPGAPTPGTPAPAPNGQPPAGGAPNLGGLPGGLGAAADPNPRPYAQVITAAREVEEGRVRRPPGRLAPLFRDSRRRSRQGLRHHDRARRHAGRHRHQRHARPRSRHPVRASRESRLHARHQLQQCRQRLVAFDPSRDVAHRVLSDHRRVQRRGLRQGQRGRHRGDAHVHRRHPGIRRRRPAGHR